MSDQKIMAAFQVRLTSFAATKSVAIAYEGTSFAIDQTKTHLADYLLPANTDNPSMGRTHRRYLGIYQVTVDAPSGTNPVTLRNLANDLAGYFPRGQAMTQAGQRVWVTRTPSIGPLIAAAGRMTRAVSIPYQSDVFTT